MLGAAAGAAVDDAFLAKLPFQRPVCLPVCQCARCAGQD